MHDGSLNDDRLAQIEAYTAPLLHRHVQHGQGELCRYEVIPSDPDPNPDALPGIAFIVRHAADGEPCAFTLQDYLTADAADELAAALSAAATLQRSIDAGAPTTS